MIRKDFTKPDGRQLHLYSRRPISENIVPTNPPHADFTPNPHMRWHPLREEWVVYAAHRQDRTFLPPKEYSPLAVTKSEAFPTELPAGDYDVAVFENLFPSLSQYASDAPDLATPTLPAGGACEVVVFTQNPDISFGRMSADEIKLVLEVLADRTKELGERADVQYVLPFENRGVEVGVTIHHPHGQLYAYPFVPPVPKKMAQAQAHYYIQHGRTLLQNLLEEESKNHQRIVTESESVMAFVPEFARYTYETWIVPKRPVQWLHQLNNQELQELAQNLKIVLLKLDTMWDKPFPYLLTCYQAPTDGEPHPGFHLHFEIYPALRTKDRLKYLAGTELGAGIFVNDSLPEMKAEELRKIQISWRPNND